LVIAIITPYFIYNKNLKEPASKQNEKVIFEIKRGQGVREIIKELEESSLIKHPTTFSIFLKKTGLGFKIKAGVYSLNKNMSILQIADILTEGKVSTLRLTIIEGWTNKDIANYLNKKSIQENELLSAMRKDYNYEFLKDKPKDQGLEGYLFPDTYFLPVNMNAEKIVKAMLDNFDTKFDKKLIEETKKQGKTIHEVVTLASIIEKEVAKEEDRAIVSGIFQKRMRYGMPLEADATVNYATGKSSPSVSYEDLKVNSPYNTYKNKGLPPGAISNPGLSAIKAALYPKESPYLYYLNRQDTKETIFSKTFEEHSENQKKYLK